MFLDVAQAEQGLARDRELNHLGAAVKMGQIELLFVRRPSRGNEPDFIQPGLFAALFCDDEVTEMDWVEGSAKESDAHDVSPQSKGCDASS
jgi:hypothetical protein